MEIYVFKIYIVIIIYTAHFGGDIDLFGLIGSNAVPLGLRNDAVTVTVPYYRWLQLLTNDVVIP